MTPAREDELVEAYLAGHATLAQVILDGTGRVPDYCREEVVCDQLGQTETHRSQGGRV